MKHTRKSLLCLLLVLLLAAAALTGCATQNETNTEAPKTDTQAVQTTAAALQTTEAAVQTTEAALQTTEAAVQTTEAAAADRPQELGEGKKTFYFDVTFSDGETASYAIHTDAETVGTALVDLELIDGELAGYGMYVKTVCGETLDWDADGMYWAFYENGEYAVSGVDSTAVTEGVNYAFVATKG